MSQTSLSNPCASATSSSSSPSNSSSQSSSSSARRRVRETSPPAEDDVAPANEESGSSEPLSSSQYFGPALRNVLVEALGSSAPLYGVGESKTSSSDAHESQTQEDQGLGIVAYAGDGNESQSSKNTTIQQESNDNIGWRPEVNYFTAQKSENRVHIPPSPPSYNDIYRPPSRISPLEALPPPIIAPHERNRNFYGTFPSLSPLSGAGRRPSEITTAYDSRAPTLRGTDEDAEHGSTRGDVDFVESMLVILMWVLLISFIWFIASALGGLFRDDIRAS
ncbi:hypothetical protein GGR57DRAFT_351027 [Xylariaceae sp. FL1272]|nr:hypothetical protein GGR57DRAFT_351027 [Xylariaceae sp. FL1272]